MAAVERVRALVEPIAELEGVELYDIEHESGVLRVMVDKPGGIDVDTLGDVSQKISAALDAHDPIPESRYLLEVTSPGIERKLRTPQHFAAQVGEEISLKVRPDVEGERRFEARIQAADDAGIDVIVTGSTAETTRRIEYPEIESARVIFNWGDNSKPGARKNNKSQAASAAGTPTSNKKASAR